MSYYLDIINITFSLAPLTPGNLDPLKMTIVIFNILFASDFIWYILALLKNE